MLNKQPRRRIRNPEERKRAQKRYYEKTKESRKAIRYEQTRQWLARHPDYHKEYGKLNKGLVNSKTWRYRASKLNAMPKWLTQEQKDQIKQIYLNVPPGHEVDHIVPLQGKNIRGLHVPWNLQYLPMRENRMKGNKYA